ncbi:MAG: hypothetical protein Q7R81_00295 [Candidatus Peregrinibacteria bacterium]|nr:hypothetical protein [Candidatus Peregrinibacteria bacterium]
MAPREDRELPPITDSLKEVVPGRVVVLSFGPELGLEGVNSVRRRLEKAFGDSRKGQLGFRMIPNTDDATGQKIAFFIVEETLTPPTEEDSSGNPPPGETD